MAKRYFLLGFCVLLFHLKGVGQLIVNQNDPQSLVGNYLFPNACYQVSNITYEGNAESLGFFANGTGTISLDRGVVMSNCRLIHVGYPSSHACGLQLNFGAVSRPEPGLGFMVFPNILEFDVVAKSNQLAFDYFFASEEYCEYLQSNKFTAFALYVSGPGIIGAPNIARVPATTSVINSKNINHNTNSAYYFSNVTTLNTSGPCAGHPSTPNSPNAMNAANGFEFDGFSSILTASVDVVPCQTYHVRAIFTNINGVSEPSAVFLKERECDFPAAEFVNTTDPTSSEVTEGCHSAELRFYRPTTSNLALPFVINYIVEPSSNATAGVDYIANFTGQITIPPGQTSIAIPVAIINDGITETIEKIDITVINSSVCNGVLKTSLYIKDPTPLKLIADDVINCSPNATLNVAVTGGSLPYKYLWQNGAQTASITVPKSTNGGTSTYYVTVTDACGVSKSIGVNVLETTFATATISSPKSYICSPADKGIVIVTFTGNAPWKYEYTIDGVAQPIRITSKNPDTIWASSPASFNLLSLNDGTCSSLLGSVQIIDNPDLGASVTTTRLRCFGSNDGKMSVNLPAATKLPVMYTWSNGAPNNSSITNLSPGYYQVTVVDSRGCYSQLGDNITEPELLDAGAFVLGDETCIKKGSASVFASGGTAPYSFLWSNGTGTALATNLSAGTNTVTITDKNGCTDTTSVKIQANKGITSADLKANSTEVNCRTPFVSLQAEGLTINPVDYTFQWGSPSPNPSLGTGFSTNITQAGNYTITITDKRNGCTVSKSINITANDLKPEAKVKLPDFLICDFVPILKLDVTGTSTGPKYTYQWSGPSGFSSKELSPSIFIPGTYSLVVTDTTNGCTRSAQVMMTNTSSPTIANAGPDQVLNCKNSTTTLGQYSSAGSTFQYQWSNGQTQRELTVDKAGIYYLTVTNTANNCVRVDTVEVKEDFRLPTANAVSIGYLNCYNKILTINGSGSGGSAPEFRWSNGGSGTSTVVSQPGIYTLSVTNTENGCVTTDTVLVRGDKNLPQVKVVKSNDIDCLRGTTTLNGSVNLTSNFTALWTSTESFSTLNPMSIRTTNPGIYNLKITNSINGCVTELQTFVSNNTQLPEVDFPLGKVLNCASPVVQLGNDKVVAGFAYSWSTIGGNIVSGSDTRNPTADKPGKYQITVTNTFTGCIKTAEVNVTENFDTPQPKVELPEAVTCNKAIVAVDASASKGNNLQFEWTTIGGTIVGSRFLPVINVSKGGIFNLTVTDPASFCTAKYQVVVEDIRQFPSVNIASPPLLTCKNPELALDASGSSGGTGYLYSWTSKNGGNIVSGQNTTNPIINKTGTYTLKITNIGNNCVSEGSISVQQDKTVPVANAGPDKTLTCTILNVALSGSGSTGPNFSYQWTTTNGAVLSGANSLIAAVNQAGTYTLIVTNKTNGCTSSSRMQVKKDPAVPVANAGQNAMINCSNSTVQLDASASSSGPNYAFTWATSNGNFVSGQNTLRPVVDKAGVYRLIVTDNVTNCKGFANVLVTLDKNPPVLKLNKPEELNCAKPTITLNTFGSSIGPQFSYYWKTADGKIEGRDSIAQVEISKSGTYQLRIYNSINTCFRDSSITIVENKNKPSPAIAKPDALNCGAAEIKLDASTSANAGNAKIDWKTTDGKIEADPRSLFPVISKAGQYTLILTDTLSFCRDSAKIVVSASTSSISALLTAPTLNCNRPTDQIITQTSGADSLYYFWSTTDGLIVKGDSSASPEVAKAGVYTLVLRDAAGCSASYSTTVKADFEKPAFNISIADTLNCFRDSTMLSANLTQAQSGISFQWQGNGIDSTLDAIQLTVGRGGVYFLTAKNRNNGCTFRDSVQVIENREKPEIALSVPDTINCLRKSIKIHAEVKSNFPYSILWSTLNGNIRTGNSSDSIEIDRKGNYLLNVVNGINGCSSSKNTEVYENINLPQFEISGKSVLNCRDSVLNLQLKTKGANYLYRWEDGTSDTLRKISNAGNYDVTAKDVLNGCESSKAISIVEDKKNPAVTLPTPEILTCNNKESVLKLSNLQPQWSVQWSLPGGRTIADSASVRVKKPGSYAVKVQDTSNFCITQLTTTVIENTVQPSVNAGADQILDCRVASLALYGNSTGSGLQILWSGPGISGNNDRLTVNVVKPGIYVLTTKRADNGCASSDSVSVTAPGYPVVQMSKPDLLTCILRSTILDATGSTSGQGVEYNWKDSNGNTISIGLTASISSPGKYQFTIRDKNTGCLRDTIVTVVENTSIPIANAGPEQIISCEKGFASLDATLSSTGSEYRYEWTGGKIVAGSETMTPKVSEPGNYRLKVTDIRNGCTDSSTVAVKSLAPVSTLRVIQPRCYGESGSIEFSGTDSGTPPYAFSVDNGVHFSDTGTFDKLVQGSYRALVKDAKGCVFSKDVKIQGAQPFLIEVEPGAVLRQGERFTPLVKVIPDTASISRVLWSPSTFLSCSDCLTPEIINATRPVTYQIRVWNQQGCEAQSIFLLKVKKSVDVYAPNVFSPNNDNANDQFTLFANSTVVVKIKSLQIYNRWGNLVFNGVDLVPNNVQEGWDGKYNGELQNPGIFVWRAEIMLFDGKTEQLSGEVLLK